MLKEKPFSHKQFERLIKLHAELGMIEILRWAVVTEIEMIAPFSKPPVVKMSRLQYSKLKKQQKV